MQVARWPRRHYRPPPSPSPPTSTPAVCLGRAGALCMPALVVACARANVACLRRRVYPSRVHGWPCIARYACAGWAYMHTLTGNMSCDLYAQVCKAWASRTPHKWWLGMDQHGRERRHNNAMHSVRYVPHSSALPDKCCRSCQKWCVGGRVCLLPGVVPQSVTSHSGGLHPPP